MVLEGEVPHLWMSVILETCEVETCSGEDWSVKLIQKMMM